MKLSPYMHIHRIEFMTTYFCPGRCKHCSVGERLNPKQGEIHVQPEKAVNAIKKIAELFPVSSVMTFGGEPLLFPEVVCAIHQAAASCGIPKRQIITNGYFSKDEKRIKNVAMKLKNSGVNDLLLSVDAFHQEKIPLGPVLSFAKSAKEAEIPNIRLQPAWLVNREHGNPYNRKTEEILAAFHELEIPVAQGNDIFPAGNALKYLAEYYPPPAPDSLGECGSAPYTGSPAEVTSVSIEPNGDMTICDFAVGNIYRENVQDIVSRYTPYENSCMKAAISGGAPALLQLAAENGVRVDGAQWYSICDICHALAEKLPSNSL
ncbi:MAG: radical SAM protein [Hydrogeniiclostridium sp.]